MRKTWLKMPWARRAACVVLVLACALAGFGSADALHAAIGDLFDDAHLWDSDALPSVPDSCTYSFCEETAALQVQLTPGTDSGEKGSRDTWP